MLNSSHSGTISKYTGREFQFLGENKKRWMRPENYEKHMQIPLRHHMKLETKYTFKNRKDKSNIEQHMKKEKALISKQNAAIYN